MASRLRVGLIGAGRWGKVYIRTLQALSERVCLTRLCTRNPENAGLVPNPVTVMSAWRDLVESDCDAVIVATPPATHAEIVEACIDAGKPCLVEKPLCLDVPTAQRLHDRARRTAVPVLVGHTFLFTPGYRALKQTLRQRGAPIRGIVSEGMSWGPFRTHTAALWDWCPHDVALCIDLLEAAPERVEALGGPRSPQGEPEMVSIRLGFRDGVCAWIHAGRLGSERRRNLSVITDDALYRFDDRAADTLTTAPISFVTRYSKRLDEPLEWVAIDGGGVRPSMEYVVTYFLDGLAGGDRTMFGTELALDVTRVLSASQGAMGPGIP